jgi:nicotinamidase-related amidase
MNEKFTLVIVDMQHDFVVPGAPMAVPDAMVALDNIIHFIKRECDLISDVVFTADNHPDDHWSLKKNGGIWPDHCMQFTDGQKIMSVLIDTCKQLDIPYKVIFKGETAKSIGYSSFEKSEIADGRLIMKSDTDYAIPKSNKFVFCGVAGDYCVKDSIADLAKVTGYEVISVLSNGVKNIDDGTIFNNFIKENNITTI